MRRAVVACVAVLALLSGACGREASAGTANPADVAAIRGIEGRFHQAMTSKNLDQMMSLWTSDAVLTTGGETHHGAGEIRAYFAGTAPVFKPQNNWLVLTAGWRITASVHGDKAALYFECYFVDRPTKTVKAASGAHATVIRSGGQWLISSLVSKPISLNA
jgi:ketosteroid isomerase-like protein